MSMQITVNPAALTTEQREAVADFIMTFPDGAAAGRVVVDVTADTGKLKRAIAEIADSTGLAQEMRQEPAHLAREGGEADAAAAFGQQQGDQAAAAAFGSAQAPLPPGAGGAPFTAAVAPSGTAPAAMPATISAATSSVPVPPAVPSANVGQAAVPASTPPAVGVERDKNGLPWDGRIHSESKAKIADGSWRKKRGVDAALVAQVEAELRAVMSAPPAAAFDGTDWPFPGREHMPGNAAASQAAQAPAAPSAAIPAPPPAAPSVPNGLPQPGAPMAPAAILSATATSPQIASPASAVPAPPAGNGEDPRTQFVALVGRASAAIQSGKVTQAEITQCCANVGVPALPLLANRLDLVASVATSVDALIASRG